MTTTADDVWQLLAELATAQKETERRFQETDKRFEKTEQLFKESERRFQETDKQFQELKILFQKTEKRFEETEQLFKESDKRFEKTEQLFKESDKRFEKTEQLFKESERRFEKTDRQIERMSREIGNLGGKWGRFVENMVAPACETLFINRGIPVHQVSQRVKKRKDNQTLEIDVLVTNENHVLVVEVKSSLSVNDIKDLMTDLRVFRDFFPEYSQKQLYGAVAGIEIEEGADKYAYRQGLFVLAQSGESVAILNGADFQPKSW